MQRKNPQRFSSLTVIGTSRWIKNEREEERRKVNEGEREREREREIERERYRERVPMSSYECIRFYNQATNHISAAAFFVTLVAGVLTSPLQLITHNYHM